MIVTKSITNKLYFKGLETPEPSNLFHKWNKGVCDTQTDMPIDCSIGASCVQRLDDSQIHANRTRYRTLLRSSSLQEPRDPLLKVVSLYIFTITVKQYKRKCTMRDCSTQSKC